MQFAAKPVIEKGLSAEKKIIDQEDLYNAVNLLKQRIEEIKEKKNLEISLQKDEFEKSIATLLSNSNSLESQVSKLKLELAQNIEI